MRSTSNLRPWAAYCMAVRKKMTFGEIDPLLVKAGWPMSWRQCMRRALGG